MHHRLEKAVALGAGLRLPVNRSLGNSKPEGHSPPHGELSYPLRIRRTFPTHLVIEVRHYDGAGIQAGLESEQVEHDDGVTSAGYSCNQRYLARRAGTRVDLGEQLMQGRPEAFRE